VNAFLEVTEGKAGLVVKTPPMFTLGAGAKAPGHRHHP
jgi:hypothetical protein